MGWFFFIFLVLVVIEKLRGCTLQFGPLHLNFSFRKSNLVSFKPKFDDKKQIED
jgi:hypothetical protein